MGSHGIFLLNSPSKVFGSTSQGKVKWEILGWGRNVNVKVELVVSSDCGQIVLDNGDGAISLDDQIHCKSHSSIT